MMQYLTCSASKRIALVTAIEQKVNTNSPFRVFFIYILLKKKNTMNSLNDL